MKQTDDEEAFDSEVDGPEGDSPGTSLEPGDYTREEFLELTGDADLTDFYFGQQDD